MDALPPVAYWDAELRNRLSNNAFCELLGFTAEQVLGRRMPEVVHPDLLRVSQRKFELALAGKPQQFDRVTVDHAGATVFLQVSLIPDVADGHVRGVVAHAVDVTARRQAEAELAATQSRFKLALMASPVGIATVGIDWRLNQANPALAEIVGCSLAELEGRSLEQLMSVGWPDTSRSTVAGVLSGDLDSTTTECEITRADGSRAAVIVNLARGSEGDPSDSVCILQVQDITTRKRAEESVRRSQRLLEQAETVARMGTWEWDLRDDRVYWSAGLCDILQLPPEEADEGRSHHMAERVHPDDRDLVGAAIQRTIAEPTCVSIEYRAIRADGRVRVLHLQSDPIFDAAGSPVRVIAVLHDITESKRKQQVLSDASSNLAKYAQELQRLAGAEGAATATATATGAGRDTVALSAKQLETVRLVAQGLTNSEIAKRMFVSEATVKWHVKQILAKTGSANRTEAVARVLGASPQRMDRSS